MDPSEDLLLVAEDVCLSLSSQNFSKSLKTLVKKIIECKKKTMDNHWTLVLICGVCAAISVNSSVLFCADLSSVLSHANVSIEASEGSAAANDDEPFDDDVAPNGTDGNAATSS